MDLYANQLFQIGDREDGLPIQVRLLWINSSSENIVLIEINNKAALPYFHDKTDWVANIENGSFRSLEYDLGSEKAYLLESEIPEPYRSKRDKNYELIHPVIESGNGIDQFIEQSRGHLISEVAHQTGVAKSTIYRLLRIFWQRGQVRNALLPDWENSGGRGKSKASNGIKRGRPRAATITRTENPGVNVTPQMIVWFRKGYDKFYTRLKSLKKTYQQTILMYFNQGYDKNGVPVPKPPEQLPTYNQFLYHIRKYRDPVNEIIKLEGKTVFNQQFRPLLSDTRANVKRAGHVYEIDAQICPVYLINPDNRLAVGQPTIYFAVDTTSSVIPAFAATHENPSWSAVSLLFENMVADKVEYCLQYDISIEPEMWPQHFLPNKIRADNGELSGDQIYGLLASEGVEVENLPAARPDLKPNVESAFKHFWTEMVSQLPGAIINDNHEVAKQKASLSLQQFIKIMINYVLWRNNNWRMEHYPLTKDMAADGLQPYPNQIWEYSMRTFGEPIKVKNTFTFYVNLLPREDNIHLVQEGISFKGLHYVCELGFKEGWFVKRRKGSKSQTVSVCYNPNTVDYIFLRLDNGRQIEKCYLSSHTHSQRYKGLSWEQYKHSRTQSNGETYAASSNDLYSIAQRDAATKEVVEEAKNLRRNNGRTDRKTISKNRSEIIKEERSSRDYGLASSIDGEDTLQISSSENDIGTPASKPSGRPKRSDKVRKHIQHNPDPHNTKGDNNE